jgi:hypothetical protein
MHELKTTHECIACFLREAMTASLSIPGGVPLFKSLYAVCHPRALTISKMTQEQKADFPDMVQDYSMSLGLEGQRVFECVLTDDERAAHLAEASTSLKLQWQATPKDTWPMLKQSKVMAAAQLRFKGDNVALRAHLMEMMVQEQKRLASCPSSAFASNHVCS